MSLLKIRLFTGLLLLVSVITGCAQIVVSNVSAFSALGAERGTIRIQAGADIDGESLEFAHYRGLLAEQLSHHGFNVLEPSAEGAAVDLTAVLSYSVVEASPNSSSYRAAYWQRSWYGLSPPASGLVVLESRDDIRRQYKRRVAVHMTSNGSQKRVYEVVGESIGACEVISVVFDEMMEALFLGFPRSSGSVEKIRVNGDSRC